MSDLSNRTILLLILVSIIISFVGIFSAPKGITYITGFASSGSSSVSFDIASEASVLVTRSIDFGSGRVNATAANAILDTDIGAYNISFFRINSPQPPARGESPLAYDSKRNVIVLFGGFDGSSFFNDTWELNSSGYWNEITGTAMPSKRYRSGMVFDSKRNVTVLFGGSTSGLSGFLNDTWEYNGTAWTQIATATAPSPRQAGFGMAFDNRRNITVLHGGLVSGSAISNETWEYNGTNWNLIATSTTAGKRWLPTMAFDSSRGVAIMFGGTPDGATLLNETWEYNGTNWTNRTFANEYPSARVFGAFVYDSIRNVSVLFGGTTTLFYFHDSWVYNGIRWYHNQDADDSYDALNLSGDPDNILGVSGGGAFNSALNLMVYFIGDTDLLGATNITIARNATTNTDGVINGTWFFMKQYFHIENDGTVNISINYTADKDASGFIGGTSPSFKLKAVADPSNIGACLNQNTTYTEISNVSSKQLCPLLFFGQGTDNIRVPVRLVIPGDAVAGVKTATITFTAYQVP